LECNENKRFYIEVDFGLFKKDGVSSFSSNRNPWDYRNSEVYNTHKT